MKAEASQICPRATVRGGEGREPLAKGDALLRTGTDGLLLASLPILLGPG